MEVSKILKPKTKEEINYRLNLLKPDRKLLASSQFGRIDGVKDAIGKGADINTCTDDDPSTALDLAIGSSNFEIAKYLLDHGATVGNYALCDSMEREDIFRLLLEKLSPDMCSTDSLELAFDVAAEKGKTHLIRLMEEKISACTTPSKTIV